MKEITKEEFEKFVKKHPRFFAKPVGGTGGYDAGIMELKDNFDELNPIFMMAQSGARGNINQLRQAIKEMGIEEGNIVRILDYEFEYRD